MSGVRGLVGGLIAAVLVIGLLPGLAIARPGFNLGDWDVVLTYEVDSNGDITYTESGNYNELIDCTGGWTKVLDTTGTGPLNKEIDEFAIDYATGKFGYIHIEDGIKVERTSVCNAFGLDDVKTSSAGLIYSLPACIGSTQMNDEVVESETIAPLGLSDNFFTDFSDDGMCYTMKAATAISTQNPPLTGVISGAVYDGTTGGNPVVWVDNWVVIGGEEWVPGEPDSNVEGWDELRCTSDGCFWEAQAATGSEVFGLGIEGGVGGYGHIVEIHESAK